jgi:hypothetical protein
MERYGVYQVWHKKTGEVFTRVADVEIGNLLGALVLTMHRKDEAWQDLPQVTALVAPTRSTEFGDRIVDPDGVVYSIERHRFCARFKEIQVSPEVRESGHLSLAGLFAEIRHDTALGKREDAHYYGDAFRQILDGKTDPPPPGPVKDNDHDHER